MIRVLLVSVDEIVLVVVVQHGHRGGSTPFPILTPSGLLLNRIVLEEMCPVGVNWLQQVKG